MKSGCHIFSIILLYITEQYRENKIISQENISRGEHCVTIAAPVLDTA